MGIASVASYILILAGLFFFFAGLMGLLRFPDIFSRLHALTKVDNLGLGLIVLGLLCQVSSVAEGLQLLLVWILVMAASAISCYLIANHVKESQ